MNARDPEELLAELLSATHSERMPFKDAMAVLASALVGRARAGGLTLGDVMNGVVQTFMQAQREEQDFKRRAAARRAKGVVLQ